MEEIKVLVADASHEKYVDTILETMAAAAKVRGTGIAKRTHEYLATKMKENKAVIALSGERFAGFSYIETWGNKHYVTTSGLIVHPDFRGLGVSKRIKDMTFTLARTRWPEAKIFSLTSGSAVMKMNNELGYRDATIVSDSVVRYNDKTVDVYLTIDEGDKYYIRNIEWVGNTIYPSDYLSAVLGMKPGDVYNQKMLNKRTMEDEDAVANL